MKVHSFLHHSINAFAAYLSASMSDKSTLHLFPTIFCQFDTVEINGKNLKRKGLQANFELKKIADSE